MTVFKTTDKHAREGSHCDVRALSLYDTYQVPVIMIAILFLTAMLRYSVSR